ALLLVAIGAAYLVSNARLNTTYAITPPPLAIPSDAASISRGQHLAVAVARCVDCHGDNLAGKVFLDEPPGRIVAPNLTRGAGGVAGLLSDADWVRAIRDGVGPNGKALLIMPAEYSQLSDADLAAIISYVKSTPPVDNDRLPSNEVRLLGH